MPKDKTEQKKVQMQLVDRIMAGYKPSHDFESAEDHNVPFDELTEQQFNEAPIIAYESLMHQGRFAEARRVVADYGLQVPPVVYEVMIKRYDFSKGDEPMVSTSVHRGCCYQS